MRVGIVGLGTVGRAQARMFAGHDLVCYDKADGGLYPLTDAGCEFAVICVDTPPLDENGCADLRSVYSAVRQLPGGLPVLIRSTVTPGTTESLARITGRLAAHAPEFIHEREGGAWRDPGDVPFLILGGDTAAREFFGPRLARVYPGKIVQCEARVAEMVKYVANAYWAAQVTFVNEMGAIARQLGMAWEDVRQVWLADERVTGAYTRLAGFPPGFGGRCWPKDLAAITALADAVGYDPQFLRAVAEANERFRP